MIKLNVLLLAAISVAECCLGQSRLTNDSTRMPPRGITLPAEIRTKLEQRVAELGRNIESLKQTAGPGMLKFLPDVQIYYYAVSHALEDDIFYKTNDFKLAEKFTREGMDRAAALRMGQTPWNNATGLVVRGYVSKIDGSVQPYGLVVPASYTPGSNKPHRLDFWFHGRGDKLSEISFISERESKAGEFTPQDTIVLHPYGRFCNAYKFAGEVDAFEALEDVRKHYPIDENRILVRGFSMGGAATWHMAAHHAGLWAGASPGAGFVETAIYQNIFKKEPQPTWYEQKLWHLYDATDYAGNLFNCPTIAYSGEIDPQKQAADLMSKAMSEEGLKLVHIIGPNTAHKYEPKAKMDVAAHVDALAAKGRNPLPTEIRFTTWTLRYNQMNWVTIDGLEEHWKRADLHAKILNVGTVRLDTTNINAITLEIPEGQRPFAEDGPSKLLIDGQELHVPAFASDKSWTVHLVKNDKQWSVLRSDDRKKIRKQHGLQGPIDDAFMDSFIMVRPTGAPLNDKVGQWTTNELTHAVEQWRLQFRGAARVKNDSEISEEDIATSNLVLWGDPRSNRLLAKILDRLPVHWNADSVRIAKNTYSSSECIPVMIYPNPLNPKRYIVLNSGFTFSEVAHLSNSLQVPKLPDYAIIALNTPRSTRLPSGVLEAGFFGENWELPIEPRAADHSGKPK